MTAYHATSGTVIDFATLSRCGARDYNEDACGYWTSDTGACFVVSDGAGGHGGGDVASETAVKTFLAGFSGNPLLTKEATDSLLTKADAAVRYGQTLSDGLEKMSATVAGLFLSRDATQAQWVHVGDTRIYLIRRQVCQLLTKDHSLVQRFIDNGVMDEAEAHNKVSRSVLYAALGTGESVPPASLTAPFSVVEGDAFLICSDGFWESLPQATLVATLGRAACAEEWLLRLEQELIAVAEPSQDNYSALAVWIGGPNDITLAWAGDSIMTAADA
ncbi:PP2C family protein-serine/threonine phosphatase [Gilvimarinus japonicus]|uniref:PP2C family serine/threonine-protein phosphatase n=1 Tax=Gilvimarinus japonicus TaxID=1796469 RepID=A0ABV7HJ07_9GAMM